MPAPRFTAYRCNLMVIFINIINVNIIYKNTKNLIFDPKCGFFKHNGDNFTHLCYCQGRFRHSFDILNYNNNLRGFIKNSLS